MGMTKKQWDKAGETLDSQFKTVKLKCDDYVVTLRLARITKMRLGIVVLVNDSLCGVWFNNSNLSEEARRFFPLRHKSFYSTKEKTCWKKLKFSKEYLQEHKIDLNAKTSWIDCYWPSFPALKRHFIVNNKSIELIGD